MQALVDKINTVVDFVYKMDLKIQLQDIKLNTVDINVGEIKNMVHEKFTVTSKKESDKKSYSEMLKENSEAVVIVKPCEAVAEKNSNTTKEEVKKNIDPVSMKVGISKLRNISNGGVVIGCDNKSKRDEIKTKLSEKLQENYTVELPKTKNLKLKIFHVDKADIDEENFEEKIKMQNDIEETKTLKINRIVESKNKRNVKNVNNVDIIVEVDKEVHNHFLNVNKIKIGWRICRVEDYIHVTRCYKCLGLGHIANECKNNIACGYCSENHNTRGLYEERIASLCKLFSKQQKT